LLIINAATGKKLREITRRALPDRHFNLPGGRSMHARDLALLGLPISPLVGLAQPAKQRLDAVGDPLPNGALFRLGSMRCRHNSQVHEIACTRDGSVVLSPTREGVHIRDAATGKQVGLIPIRFENTAYRVALAPTTGESPFSTRGRYVKRAGRSEIPQPTRGVRERMFRWDLRVYRCRQ
jgi:hypothetical protein